MGQWEMIFGTIQPGDKETMGTQAIWRDECAPGEEILLPHGPLWGSGSKVELFLTKAVVAELKCVGDQSLAPITKLTPLSWRTILGNS